MSVDVKIKDVWQKVEFNGFTGDIVLPTLTITVVDGIITAVTEDDSPEA